MSYWDLTSEERWVVRTANQHFKQGEYKSVSSVLAWLENWQGRRMGKGVEEELIFSFKRKGNGGYGRFKSPLYMRK